MKAERDCNLCNGKGHYTTHPDPDNHRLTEEVECRACKGSGRFNCEEAHEEDFGEQNTCPHCWGSGENPEIIKRREADRCLHCGGPMPGLGEQRIGQLCEHCAGFGPGPNGEWPLLLDCPRCKGEGDWHPPVRPEDDVPDDMSWDDFGHHKVFGR